MTQMRQATKEDFKVGATLINHYGYWTIRNHYTEGVWEAHCISLSGGNRGEACIFEGEARFYQIKS